MNTYDLALIGHPVSSNMSYRCHQCFLPKIGLNATYGKFDIEPQHLNTFMAQAKQDQMTGLSVTMPLKEHIMPLLDNIDAQAQKIGAVNTVKFSNGKATGYNTDGIGAVQAIKYRTKQSLHGKRAIVVGAGGAAKAIATMLANEDVQVTVTNRTFDKAATLANAIKGQAKPLESLKSLLPKNDMLIQATSMGMLNQDVIINPQDVPNNMIVFDVLSAPQNGWLDTLVARGCTTVPGRLMWIFQAIEQYRIWYNDQIDLSHAFDRLQDCVKMFASSSP